MAWQNFLQSYKKVGENLKNKRINLKITFG